MRSFIQFSVLDEISCGFAVFSDFLRGFSVSNRPLCPPLYTCNMGLTLSKTRQTMLNIDWHDILPLLYFDEIDYDS